MNEMYNHAFYVLMLQVSIPSQVQVETLDALFIGVRQNLRHELTVLA